MKGDSSIMMMPEEFWQAVARNEYPASHPKVVAHMKAIKKLKKTSMANSVVYVHKVDLPEKVGPNFVPLPPYEKGARISLMGTKKCPEIVAGLEMKMEDDGFQSPTLMGASRDVRLG
ncbi:hypothetical protein FisN_2Lu361 [Fistulifera solaris]|uniref:Uncharacterized protein n=1 Tax=Fistulifera solaris TaxID=1519565 RepID=A0A1Z5J803_FISSO|nr:hypothetical protein FisN_2Lu361 [Fistulifera solaris]|eukprot:GAX10089.1 hypothetical protein FisN_2Lu361 [Fistulifera solaris]